MIMSSLARVKFIKTRVIFRYHTKGISNQASSSSDQEIKSYSCSNSSTKVGKKRKSGKTFSELQNGTMRRLQIRARGITNRGSFRDFKSGQRDYKSRQGFQIGAKRFQIRARGISNRGRDYKSVQSKSLKISNCLFILHKSILMSNVSNSFLKHVVNKTIKLQ